MKISVGENSEIVLEEVFNPITLISGDGETFSICMRDSGFEFTYDGKTEWDSTTMEAKKGMLDIL